MHPRTSGSPWKGRPANESAVFGCIVLSLSLLGRKVLGFELIKFKL